MRYRVRVTKDYLVFSSGHFITYSGNRCERLHGHNYRASVEIEDELDENHYVFDFILLKDLTREIVDELDHRMLLPTKNRLIHVERAEEQIEVRYNDNRWSFPSGDCVLLPIANTTAELLASYILERLLRSIADRGLPRPKRASVEVEESFGQSAFAETEETS